jgi:hypothetical protein
MCRQQAVINQDVDMATLQAQSKKIDTSRLFDGLLPMVVRYFVTMSYILCNVCTTLQTNTHKDGATTSFGLVLKQGLYERLGKESHGSLAGISPFFSRLAADCWPCQRSVLRDARLHPRRLHRWYVTHHQLHMRQESTYQLHFQPAPEG